MAEQVKESLSEMAAASSDLERTGLRTWDFATLPQELETPGPTHTIRAFPALVDEGDTVAIRLFPNPHEQTDAMWLGTRRLLRLQLPSPVRTLDRLVDQPTKLALMNPPVQSKAQWYNDCIDAALDDAIAQHGGPPWDAVGFDALVTAASQRLPETLALLADSLRDLVGTLAGLLPRVDALLGSSVEVSINDINAHIDRLAYPGFVSGVGVDRVPDVARYLQAIEVRLDQLLEHPRRDLQRAAECVAVEQRHRDLVARCGLTPSLEALTWELEELRVATFAERLKRAGKISATRIGKQLAIAESEHQ
jgi:ATP-dependent helicase HrpA